MSKHKNMKVLTWLVCIMLLLPGMVWAIGKTGNKRGKAIEIANVGIAMRAIPFMAAMTTKQGSDLPVKPQVKAIEERSKTDGESAAVQVENMSNQTQSPSTRSNVQMFLLAIVISSLGTALVLFLATRDEQWYKTKLVILKTESKKLLDVRPLVLLLQTQIRKRWAVAEAVDSSEVLIVPESTAKKRARRYNSEELDLIMKFRQHDHSAIAIKELGLLMDSAQPSDRVTVARLTGMGQGEVELALHLQEFQQSTMVTGGQS